MPVFTRRAFLRGGVAACAAAGAAHGLSGCAPGAPPFNPTSDRARVVAIRGKDLRAMTLEMLEAHGGAGAIVHEGESVLIKPNFGACGMVKYNPVQAGDVVKPEIVLTVAEECLKAGAREVVIGEGGQIPRLCWSRIETLDGTTNVGTEVARMAETYSGSIRTVSLNGESPSLSEIRSYCRFGRLFFSSLLSSVDRVISIGVAKTHRWTQVTGTMKNFVGATPISKYALNSQWRFFLHEAGIEQAFLDIVDAVRPDFGIIDFSICCEGNGPHVLPGYWGTSVDMRDRLGDWLLLGGADLAAVDATMARVVQHDVSQVRHLQMAYDMGIGQIQEDRIDLDGAALGELQVDWEPAEPVGGFLSILIPGIMLIS